jgi:subtilase family serine protease
LLVQQQIETPEYAQAFNQIFMEGAAQGISMFAAAGDEGAYDAVREFGLLAGIPGVGSLSVDNPADSPYITAAGGTTLPFHFHSNKYNYDVKNDNERAWGWDYLYGYFDKRGLNNPQGWGDRYLAGGGGGFSQIFATPDYQLGVSGINSYTATKQWTPNSNASTLTRDAAATILTGTGKGRNMPDVSMNADPYTGYKVLFSDPAAPGTNRGYAVYGGTSFVSPQLNGLSALINSSGDTQVGFWNPQIYRFAQGPKSPLHPLNDTGILNDNGFYTGTPGTIYNQATGLGTPDISVLANAFVNVKNNK